MTSPTTNHKPSKSVPAHALLVLAMLFILIPTLADAYIADRVVLVIIDGLRYSEGLGDPTHEFVPRMAALAEQGTIVDDFQNDGYTYTSRAIPAIWCGAWTEINTFSDPYCNGTTNNTSVLPTVFEYYRKQLSRPAEDCIYALKDLCSWKASHDPNYGPGYWPLYHTEGYTDIAVWQETEQIIADEAPHFLMMYLADVDHEGHSGVWSNYTRAIAIADSIVGTLWNVLQADTAYAGKTTLLVTNDHGRHDYDFSGHGDGCEGCRHIQLLALGPDIQTGLISDVSRTIPDITPTIGELLGFTTESATGTAMLELLVEDVAIDAIQMPALQELTVYPNPGNQGTTLAFTLPFSGEVDLQIYDLLGRLVRNLLDGHLQAGPVQISWDGADDQGRALSSGSYLVRLKTDTDVRVSKVVIIR